jgi:hypothetical protein
MSPIGPSLPISEARFDGEFWRDSGLVVLMSSFVEIDPEQTLACGHPEFMPMPDAEERHDGR